LSLPGGTLCDDEQRQRRQLALEEAVLDARSLRHDDDVCHVSRQLGWIPLAFAGFLRREGVGRRRLWVDVWQLANSNHINHRKHVDDEKKKMVMG
jgi:hypothetical protein